MSLPRRRLGELGGVALATLGDDEVDRAAWSWVADLMFTHSPACAVQQAERHLRWADVVAELRESCARRAPAGALLDVAGATAVLAGSSPIVWVYGAADPGCVDAVLAAEPRVREVYVEASRAGVVDALLASGWTVRECMRQLVRSTDAADCPPVGIAVVALTGGDLADVRELLSRHGGVDAEQVANSYPEDFFTVAAPVWMFGARDATGRLVGVVAVRRQHRSAMGFALTLAPAWWGSGLSSALIAAAIDQARAAGAQFVHAQAGERGTGRLTADGFTAVGAWVRLTR